MHYSVARTVKFVDSTWTSTRIVKCVVSLQKGPHVAKIQN